MENFKNRVPTNPNRKKITKLDGSIEYATIEFADDATEEGTPLNKATLNKMQDLTNFVIRFETNGDITKVYSDGTKTIVQFLQDGNIKETYFRQNEQKSLEKTITFKSSGDIETEVVTFD